MTATAGKLPGQVTPEELDAWLRSTEVQEGDDGGPGCGGAGGSSPGPGAGAGPKRRRPRPPMRRRSSLDGGGSAAPDGDGFGLDAERLIQCIAEAETASTSPPGVDDGVGERISGRRPFHDRTVSNVADDAAPVIAAPASNDTDSSGDGALGHPSAILPRDQADVSPLSTESRKLPARLAAEAVSGMERASASIRGVASVRGGSRRVSCTGGGEGAPKRAPGGSLVTSASSETVHRNNRFARTVSSISAEERQARQRQFGRARSSMRSDCSDSTSASDAAQQDSKPLPTLNEATSTFLAAMEASQRSTRDCLGSSTLDMSADGLAAMGDSNESRGVLLRLMRRDRKRRRAAREAAEKAPEEGGTDVGPRANSRASFTDSSNSRSSFNRGPMGAHPRASFGEGSMDSSNSRSRGPMDNNKNSRASFNCGSMGNNSRASFNEGPTDSNSRASFTRGPFALNEGLTDSSNSRSSFNRGPMNANSRASLGEGSMNGNPRASFDRGPMDSDYCGPADNNPGFDGASMDDNPRSSFNRGPTDGNSRSSFNCGPTDNNSRDSFNRGPTDGNSRPSFNCGPTNNNSRDSFNCGPMDNNSRSSFNRGPMDGSSRSTFSRGPGDDDPFSEGFAIGRAMRDARASFGTDPSMMMPMNPMMMGMNPMMMMMMNSGGGGMMSDMMDSGMGRGRTDRDAVMSMMTNPAAIDRVLRRDSGGLPTTDSIDEIYASCRERASRRVSEYTRMQRRGSGGGMGLPGVMGGDFDATGGGATAPCWGPDDGAPGHQPARQSSSQARDRPGGESADERAIRSELERLQRETREMEARLRCRGTGEGDC